MILYQWMNSIVILIMFGEFFFIDFSFGKPLKNQKSQAKQNTAEKSSNSRSKVGYRTDDLLDILQNGYDYQESDGYGNKESELSKQLKGLPDLNRNIPTAEKVKLGAKDECGPEGLKRIGKNQMHFVNYDVCLNGKWESKRCEKGSLFWVVTDCCIPIEKYPTIDNCIQIKEGSNQNKTMKIPHERKLRIPVPEITSKKSEKLGSEETGSQNPISIDKDNLDTYEEEPYESVETSNDQSSDNSEAEWGGYRHKDDEEKDENKDKLHVTTTTPKSKDQDNSKEKDTSENKVNDEKNEFENDSEYEGFERIEIAELIEKDSSKELNHEKQSMENTNGKGDKTNSKEGTDEEYEDIIDTTPEALSTKGEDKDLMNKKEGNPDFKRNHKNQRLSVKTNGWKWNSAEDKDIKLNADRVIGRKNDYYGYE